MACDSFSNDWTNRGTICDRSKPASAPSDRRRERPSRNLHLKVDLMPEEYVAESLVRAFAAEDLAGKRVLLPRAAVARDVIPVELEKLRSAS